MSIVLVNLFLIGCAMVSAVLGFFTILWLVRPLDRLQGGGDGSSLGIKRHGRVRPFQVMSRGPIAPALAGSPLVGVLRMETHIPVLLP